MEFEFKAFDALSPLELYNVLRLRNAVFIVEQNCPYQDLDEKDQATVHVLGYDKDRLVAYARILPPGTSCAEAGIGRVLTAKSHRGLGVGQILMSRSINETRRLFPGADIRISAQAYLESFYMSFGFQRVGTNYLEDNIPHLPMLLKAE